MNRRKIMIPRFEVFKDRKGKWRFRLRATNGRVIASSEVYASKRNAILGIRSIQECAPDAIILYEDN